MKKMIKNLMLVAVAAMAFVACSQEDNEINISAKKTIIEFTAEINEETRSQFGDKVDGAYPSFWSGNESVSFYATDNYGYVEDMTISDDKKQATFTVAFNSELSVGDVIYAYSGESWTGAAAANKIVSITDTQRSTETSVGDSNHYLFAKYTVGEEGVTAPISLSFNHGAAYGKMQLPQFTGSEITEVKITIDENTYTVVPQSSLWDPIIWFACYEDTNIKTFSVETKINGRKYGKTIDMASKANPLTFTTGTVSSFSVEGLEEIPADYEVVLSSYTINNSTDRKTWVFSNEAGDYLSISFNPNIEDELPAGNYTAVDMAYQFSTDNALEYSRYDTSYNLTVAPNDYARWADDVVVNISRDEHNMLDFTAYVTGSVDGYTKTTKFTYKEVYIEVSEFDGTIKSWTYTNTSMPTYYQIAGDNFSFEIGFYNNYENYIAKRDAGYTLGDASWFLKYFAIRNLVINGESLTASAGTVTTNTAGTAGAIHDIDITLTANGNDYEFSYYGYINGVAVDNDGGDETPVVLETPSLTVTATGNTVTATWVAVTGAANYSVTLNGEDKGTITDTSISFSDLAYSTDYTVTVVANPDDSTANTASAAATATVTTEADPNAGGNEGGEAKQVTLTYFTNNGTSDIFKGDDGHNYLIAFRSGSAVFNTPMDLTDSNKFQVTSTGYTNSNTEYFNLAANFSTGDTITLTQNGYQYKAVINAVVDGKKVVATCEAFSF